MRLDEEGLSAFADLPSVNIATSNKATLTTALAKALSQGDWAMAALRLGYRSQTLSTAFFFGYQVAARHLDEHLSEDQLAAFAASEKGVRSSRDYTTQVSEESGRFRLNGEKSHVMLMQRQLLDFIYVLANDAAGELCCLKVAAPSSGVQPRLAQKPQPFVVDVPHTAVSFDQCICEPDYCISQAHQRLFKPFRYWEDVMVALSYCGWMLSRSHDSHLLSCAANLIEQYSFNPDYYCEQSLKAIEVMQESLASIANNLSVDDRSNWQKDGVLLSLGAATREKIKRTL